MFIFSYLLLLLRLFASFREFSLNQEMSEIGTVTSEDFLDDGTPIRFADMPSILFLFELI